MDQKGTETLYLVDYKVISKLGRHTQISELGPKEIQAFSDEEAIQKAHNLRQFIGFELMAKNRFSDHGIDVSKKVILVSIRNQDNKRIIYLAD